MSAKKKAIEALAAGVQDVKKATDSAKAPALSKMADEDWGWKGHKPTDLSPSEFYKLRRAGHRSWDRTGENDKLEEVYWDKAAKTLGWDWVDALTEKRHNTSWENIDEIMGNFSYLQKRGMPREWTGKFNKAITMSPLTVKMRGPSGATDLISQFRKMDTAQRNAMIELLPEWPGTSDQLVAVSKEIDSMSPSQKETLMTLLPEWQDTPEQLIETARSLGA